jgi:hypothetical protein
MVRNPRRSRSRTVRGGKTDGMATPDLLEVTELVTDSYRIQAPKRLARLVD